MHISGSHTCCKAEKISSAKTKLRIPSEKVPGWLPLRADVASCVRLLFHFPPLRSLSCPSPTTQPAWLKLSSTRQEFLWLKCCWKSYNRVIAACLTCPLHMSTALQWCLAAYFSVGRELNYWKYSKCSAKGKNHMNPQEFTALKTTSYHLGNTEHDEL